MDSCVVVNGKAVAEFSLGLHLNEAIAKTHQEVFGRSVQRHSRLWRLASLITAARWGQLHYRYPIVTLSNPQLTLKKAAVNKSRKQIDLFYHLSCDTAWTCRV